MIWLFLPNFSVGHRVWGVKNHNFWKKKRLTNSRFAAKPIYPHLLKWHDSLVLAGAWKNWIFIKKSEIFFLFQKILCLLCFFENIVSNLNWESNGSKKHKCKTKIFQMSYCANFCLIMMVIYAVIFRYKREKSYCSWSLEIRYSPMQINCTVFILLISPLLTSKS